MTYCLGIRVREGLIALADGRVTSGSQMAAARKMITLGEGRHRFLHHDLGPAQRARQGSRLPEAGAGGARSEGFTSMLDAAGAFSRCLRRVWEEDGEALAASDLQFNLHAIIGGRLPDDPEATMFLVYPEGNWIEVDERTPYFSIGATAYGKPILDRALKYDTALRHALKLAYLSFDSSRFQLDRCRLSDRSPDLLERRRPLARDPF